MVIESPRETPALALRCRARASMLMLMQQRLTARLGLSQLAAFGVFMLVFLSGPPRNAAAAGTEETVKPPPVSTASRYHDGFYFRVASGFALYDERLDSDDGGRERSGRNRGIAGLGEVAVGGTIGQGWVIGGGIYSADLAASTFRTRTELPPAELDPELRSVALLGPFMDWYVNPERGLHFQAALGLSTLTPRVFGHPATERSEYLAVGGGLMLGAGYDFWIADEWSLGVLARTTLSVLGGSDDEDARWLHVVVTSPGLLATLTYH